MKGIEEGICKQESNLSMANISSPFRIKRKYFLPILNS